MIWLQLFTQIKVAIIYYNIPGGIKRHQAGGRRRLGALGQQQCDIQMIHFWFSHDQFSGSWHELIGTVPSMPLCCCSPSHLQGWESRALRGAIRLATAALSCHLPVILGWPDSVSAAVSWLMKTPSGHDNCTNSLKPNGKRSHWLQFDWISVRDNSALRLHK